MTRRVVASAMALALGTTAGCGETTSGVGPTSTDPFVAVETKAKADDRAARGRAAPRWARVQVIRRSGSGTHAFRIGKDAIQWRLRWTCEGSRFAVAVAGESLGGGDCRGVGQVAGVGRGDVDVDVTAAGRWRLTVEQQVTTAVREPPLPEARKRSSRIVARGRFRGIERRGSGRATVRRLADGRLVLRLSAFSTSANTDLAVWLSEARAPTTTQQALAAPHVRVAALKATIGDQNYVLPRDVRLARIRSIVIWCEPLRIAYTAARLAR